MIKEPDVITVEDNEIEVYSLNTVVVGSGAAGLNAAARLHSFGVTDVAIVTEHLKAGTSRNTGSDKQTYYKLTLSGDQPDSVMELASTLFSGGSMDGDIALVEASLSAKCFLRLSDLGVPFPMNRYGEYVGYKTDHDPRRRATSAGPLTSKLMTEALEQDVVSMGVKFFDHHQVVSVLTYEGDFKGLLCLNLKKTESKRRFVAFNCRNVIYATGGPAGIYADSVFPLGHYGASGIAFEAGVHGRNLTEWQYGLASIRPRWNVSGTFMQVLPRFISTDEDGENSHEFLLDFFSNSGEMLTKVFKKGYEWPFDVRKIAGGSSIIDILVYRETRLKGRRVFLDYGENPLRLPIKFEDLDDEAYTYLENAGALFGTPIERLCHMNMPAYEFYLDKGVDLSKEPLEIALCAQHNNGGIAVDMWWQSNIKGFFAAGEVAGSHGIYRPGGSALNSGQVGSTRAAQFISAHRRGDPEKTSEFIDRVHPKIRKMVSLSETMFSGNSNVDELWDRAQARMSKVGAAIRCVDHIEEEVERIRTEMLEFGELVSIESPLELKKMYRLYDVILSQFVYLSAMADYIKKGGRSRGSALYTDSRGEKPDTNMEEMFRFKLDDSMHDGVIQEVQYREGKCSFTWRPVREIPVEEGFFENVWRQYRENGNIY